METTRKELHALINSSLSPKTRLVIFIDDLDRCQSTQTLQLLEAINQLLNSRRVAVVLSCDLRTVAAHVYRKRIHDDAISTASTSPERLGLSYLQKIVQLQFDVPAPSQKRMSEVVQHWMSSTEQAKPSQQSVKLKFSFKAWAEQEFLPWRQLAWDTKALQMSRIPPTGHWLNDRILQGLQYLSWMGLTIFVGLRRSVLPRELRSQFPTQNWRKFGRYAATTFLLLLLVGTLIVLTGFIPSRTWQILLAGTFASIAGFALLLFVMFLLIGFIGGPLSGLGIRRKYRTALSAKLPGQENEKTDDPSAETIAARLVRQTQEDLARSRKYEFFVKDSPALQDALAGAAKHFPDAPRFAKRMLNRLRLQAFICSELGLFSPAGPITPNHLGTWVVFQERWPDAYLAVCRSPEVLLKLESRAIADSKDTDEFASFFVGSEGAALRKFLGQMQPPLSSFVEPLARFEKI